MFNYGLLCCCNALFSFWIALQAWKARCAGTTASVNTRACLPLSTCCTIAGLLCLLSPTLFLMQYLYADMASVVRLTNHEIQAELIKAKLGYGSATQFIPIKTMSFDPITQRGRLALLLDQIGISSFLPLAAALLLLISRQLFPLSVQTRSIWKRWTIMWGCGFVLFVLLGRAPAAIVCNYQAQRLLAQGGYTKASSGWIELANLIHRLTSCLHIISSVVRLGIFVSSAADSRQSSVFCSVLSPAKRSSCVVSAVAGCTTTCASSSMGAR